MLSDIRDCAAISELIVLSDLEAHDAELIKPAYIKEKQTSFLITVTFQRDLALSRADAQARERLDGKLRVVEIMERKKGGFNAVFWNLLTHNCPVLYPRDHSLPAPDGRCASSDHAVSRGSVVYDYPAGGLLPEGAGVVFAEPNRPGIES